MAYRLLGDFASVLRRNGNNMLNVVTFWHPALETMITGAVIGDTTDNAEQYACLIVLTMPNGVVMTVPFEWVVNHAMLSAN